MRIGGIICFCMMLSAQTLFASDILPDSLKMQTEKVENLKAQKNELSDSLKVLVSMVKKQSNLHNSLERQIQKKEGARKETS